ncbi:MAG: penicillin-binding protein activator [candidate division WOR-3 bacterium]|jgi:branched-chain amino acid transport system substrate-binding protein
MKRLIFVPILSALFIIFNCTPSMQVSTEEDVDRIYENAMKAYAEQNYKEANDLFLVVAKNSESEKLKANSFFYLGEINKATSNYGKALISYAAASHYGIKTEESIKELAALADLNSLEQSISYASEDLKPYLLYTLARKLQSVGKEKESQKFFSEIEKKYPNSEYARKAKYMSRHKGKTRVGVLLPFTGVSSQTAESVKKGIEVGSRDKFIPLYIDTRGNPVTSYKEVVELIKEKRVSGIIGPLFSRNCFAVACICDYIGIPFISPTATKEFIDSLGEECYIINRTIEQQAKAMANYAVTKLGLRTFSIFYPYSDYGETFEQFFSEKVKELGGAIVNSVSFKEGKKDFQDELNRIKENNPDAIYIPAATQDVPAIASQIKYLGIKSQILGADEWKSKEIFRQQVGASALEGIIISESPFNPTDAFSEEFNYIFRKEPDRYACLGYDAATLMGELLENPDNKGKLKNIKLTAGSIDSKSSYENVHIYMITKGDFKRIK